MTATRSSMPFRTRSGSPVLSASSYAFFIPLPRILRRPLRAGLYTHSGGSFHGRFRDGRGFGSAWHRILRIIRLAREAGGQELIMLYIIGGILAIALLVYLFVALLKPEIFS